MQITSLDELPCQIGAFNLSFSVRTPPAKIAEKRWNFNSGATRDGNHVTIEFQNLENIHLFPVDQAQKFVLAHLADPADRHSMSKVLASWLFEADDGLSLAECIYLDEYRLPRNDRYDEATLHNLLKPTYARILEKGLGVKSIRYGAMFMTPIASTWENIACFQSHNVRVKSDPDEYIHWLFQSEPHEATGTKVLPLTRSPKDPAYIIEGRYAEFNGQLSLSGSPLCALHGRATLRLGSGTLISPMGTCTKIPGVSLLEFSPILKPL